jgi:hypothetical protein
VSFGASIVQLLSAAIGGFIGGSFVLVGVLFQFRRQSEAACRALLLEVRGNVKALAQMMPLLGSGWVVGKANPGWLNRSIWDRQLPYIVQLLDAQTAAALVEAYGTLDAIPEMRQANFAGAGVPYVHGGWITTHIDRACTKFQATEDALGRFAGSYSPWADVIPQRFRDGWVKSSR